MTDITCLNGKYPQYYTISRVLGPHEPSIHGEQAHIPDHFLGHQAQKRRRYARKSRIFDDFVTEYNRSLLHFKVSSP